MVVYYTSTLADIILVVSSNSGTLWDTTCLFKIQECEFFLLSVIFKYYLKDIGSCTTDG